MRNFLLDLDNLLPEALDLFDILITELIEGPSLLASIAYAIELKVNSLIDHELILIFNFSDKNGFLIFIHGLHLGDSVIQLTVG